MSHKHSGGCGCGPKLSQAPDNAHRRVACVTEDFSFSASRIGQVDVNANDVTLSIESARVGETVIINALEGDVLVEACDDIRGENADEQIVVPAGTSATLVFTSCHEWFVQA